MVPDPLTLKVRPPLAVKVFAPNDILLPAVVLVKARMPLLEPPIVIGLVTVILLSDAMASELMAAGAVPIVRAELPWLIVILPEARATVVAGTLPLPRLISIGPAL